ncbi:hypothetical protein HYW76_02435 [Candidatus Pacearchaeota archaeon]|nr:hypothetical protein [Candidatus Pacearchaeota archaeon]
MVKIYGAVDKRKRRQRSDYGKRREQYNGKPVKRRREIIWEKKRGDKEVLKLWVWEKGIMSPEGRSKWNRRVRPFIKNIIYTPRMRIDAHVSYLTTKQNVEQFFLEVIGYTGEFLIMGFSNAGNRFHCKPVKICRIIINDSKESLRCRMIQDYRWWRYWFYHD